jgi:hypothetical protein
MERRRGSDASEVAYGELPELTRGLRALGSPRHSGGLHAVSGATTRLHADFFHALLEARRTATAARTPDGILRAFDAGELSRAMDKLIERIVVEWPDERTSARRALRTGLRERTEEYAAALSELRARADAALHASPDDQLDAWRSWTTQLVATFHAADRAWMALRSVVDALPTNTQR